MTIIHKDEYMYSDNGVLKFCSQVNELIIGLHAFMSIYIEC